VSVRSPSVRKLMYVECDDATSQDGVHNVCKVTHGHMLLCQLHFVRSASSNNKCLLLKVRKPIRISEL
jgi:hypothetical protein